jgi:hypothetical protein
MALIICALVLTIPSHWKVAETSEIQRADGKIHPLEGSGQLSESVIRVSYQGADNPNDSAAERGDIGPTAVPAAPMGIDTSVIGRAFQVSNSVESRCKHEPNLCTDVLRNLGKLEQEPRDNVWAADMEKLIQANIAEQEQKKYLIRNIECRTSVCAVEVASIFGPYLIGRDDQLHSSLRPGIATLGVYETDASGARTTVTVETFTRR